MFAPVIVLFAFVHTSSGILETTHFINALDTTISKYPWMISIRNGSGHHVCGGALIRAKPNATRSDLGITAAHCFRAYILRFRRLNSLVIAGATVDSFNFTTGEKRRIVDVQHFGYFPGDDAAVIKFDSPIEFTDRIKPVDLPEQGVNVERDASCTVTGWGLYQNHALQELKVTLQACDNRKFDYGKVFCAAGTDGSICSGDSGSPLVCRGKDDRQVQEGIVSYSDPSCGDTPATYCRVSFYSDWIRTTADSMTSVADSD